VNILPLIKNLMDMGFDGYLDDIESWVGKAADPEGTQADWLNYLTPWLHNGANFVDGRLRLNMPATAYDWRQRLNHRLNVDYICSMFYSAPSTLEDSQCEGYWQENFGIYGRTQAQYTPPASPMLIMLMHSNFNQNPLSWQLAKVDYLLNKYPHPNLYGFGVWLYEYMGIQAPDDWTVWNNWLNTLSTFNVPPATTTTSTSGTQTVTITTTTDSLSPGPFDPTGMFAVVGVLILVSVLLVAVTKRRNISKVRKT